MAKRALTLSEITNKSRRQTELARARIATSLLIDRVQGCALGTIDMTKEQLQAAEMLLKRTLPQITEHKTTIDNQITFSASTETAGKLQALLQRANNRMTEKIIQAETVETVEDDDI